MCQIKILLVDDDLEYSEVMQIAIKICCPDCQVESVSSGPAALNLLRQADSTKPFDLILTDYHMPELTGLELARVIQETWPAIRLMLMSSDRDALAAAIKGFNFDGYLVKPFALKDLAKALQLNQSI